MSSIIQQPVPHLYMLENNKLPSILHSSPSSSLPLAHYIFSSFTLKALHTRIPPPAALCYTPLQLVYCFLSSFILSSKLATHHPCFQLFFSLPLSPLHCSKLPVPSLHPSVPPSPFPLFIFSVCPFLYPQSIPPSFPHALQHPTPPPPTTSPSSLFFLPRPSLNRGVIGVSCPSPQLA